MAAGTIQGIIKQRRLMKGLTLEQLGEISGVSPSHLGRIERSERFPSARILRKLAKPLDFNEVELFTFADFLPPQTSLEIDKCGIGQLDPYVASVLSQEPVETQRAVVSILVVMKSMGKK
jgi:transcriptional regulator with XRE-family HTH domain